MTLLPVDYSIRPWRWKYLFEETPVLNFWFILGESRDGKTVTISDGNEDIFINLPREVAEEIIKARQELVDVIEKHFSNFQLGNLADDSHNGG